MKLINLVSRRLSSSSSSLSNLIFFLREYIYVIHRPRLVCIGGLQPIPRSPKDNGMAAMLDDRTFLFYHPTWPPCHCLLDLQGLVANHLLRKTVPSLPLS